MSGTPGKTNRATSAGSDLAQFGEGDPSGIMGAGFLAPDPTVEDARPDECLSLEDVQFPGGVVLEGPGGAFADEVEDLPRNPASLLPRRLAEEPVLPSLGAIILLPDGEDGALRKGDGLGVLADVVVCRDVASGVHGGCVGKGEARDRFALLFRGCQP